MGLQSQHPHRILSCAAQWWRNCNIKRCPRVCRRSRGRFFWRPTLGLRHGPLGLLFGIKRVDLRTSYKRVCKKKKRFVELLGSNHRSCIAKKNLFSPGFEPNALITNFNLIHSSNPSDIVFFSTYPCAATKKLNNPTSTNIFFSVVNSNKCTTLAIAKVSS